MFGSKQMAKHGYKQKQQMKYLHLALIGAVIGGRIGWVLENFHEYYLYAWYIFRLTDGGLEVITALLRCRRCTVYGTAVRIICHSSVRWIRFHRS
jgi:prolipoprotein diacylglyceryltransferase